MSMACLKDFTRGWSIHALSFMRVYFYNSVAPTADYAEIKSYTNLSLARGPSPGEPLPTSLKPFIATAQPIKSLTALTWDWSNSAYAPLPAGYGSTAVLGPPDVPGNLKTELQRQCFLDVVNTNIGYRGWCVLAVGLWITALPPTLLSIVREAGWFTLPLHCWKVELADILTSARRTMRVDRNGEVTPVQVTLLRKLLNITYREKDPADWKAEKHRRTVNLPVHFMPMPDGTLSRSSWQRNLANYLKSLCTRVALDTANTLRLETPSDWWASRTAWAPSGSASEHRWAEESLRDELGLSPGARANKKTTLSLLPDDYFTQQMTRLPAVFPRASTKPEPGGKARALYAIDDASFTISSYPSVGVEKYMNIDGIYAQQAPVDVAEWARKHLTYSKLGAFFLSLDYSDFNSDHELSALAMLDTCWALGWCATNVPERVSSAKAAASLWMARSHLNAWVSFPGDDAPTRIMGGLFSGHRNTARDNCMLHAAYSHNIMVAAKAIDPQTALLDIMLTGDDEDSIFESWLSALLYMFLHAMAQFELKPSKQLTGDKRCPTHEYLQRTLVDGPQPCRPLCAALAQLCSGNWYDTNYVWLDGIISSVNDNCWELTTRGLPWDVAQSCATHILNRAMTVKLPRTEAERAPAANSGPVQPTWQKLEWWAFRTNGKYHPLWHAVSHPAPTVPLGEEAVVVPRSMPGVDAWLAKARRRFPTALSADKEHAYGVLCKREAVAPLFKKERNTYMHRGAVRAWPARGTFEHKAQVFSNTPLRSGLPDNLVAERLLYSQAERHPQSEAQLVSRFGLDLAYVTALGGITRLLKLLSPRELSQYETIVAAPPRPWWTYLLDPAINSWVGQTLTGLPASMKATSPPYLKHVYHHQETQAECSRRVHIVLAGNATGKTTSWFQERWEGVMDMDTLLRDAQLMTRLRRCAHMRAPALPLSLTLDIARAVQACQPRVLLLQYPVAWIRPALQAAGWTIGNVAAARIDLQSMLTRTNLQRGWTVDKATRRYERFEDALQAWRTSLGSHSAIPEFADVDTALQALTA
jgi:hypothetical protein